MIVTFLGTGTSQGVPAIGIEDEVSKSSNFKDKRLRCSVNLNWNNKSVNIDCSPDFRTQMLANNIKSLHSIIFTHEHADHTAGLDDIRPYVFLNNSQDMPIYAEKRVLDQLKKRFDYIFETENRYPGAPSVLVNEILEDKPFYVFSKKIIPIRVMHGNLPILGYRIDNLSYITDMKTISEKELKKLHKTEVLIVNSLRKEPHPTHMCLSESLDIVKEIAPKKTYFVHMSQKMGLHDLVQEQLPKNVFLAYDSLKIEV